LFTTLIFVNDTSHAIFTVMAIYAIMTVSAVNTFSTFFYMNVYTVSTIKAIYTVFTIDTNLTIFTVFTNVNGFYIKIFIQCIVNSCITISIISLFYSHVFTSLEINGFTVFDFLASITCMSTHCSGFCRGSYLEGTHVTASRQVRQVDNCFSTSLISASTVIVFQYNLFCSCIILVSISYCTSCCVTSSSTSNMLTSTVRFCWSNVKFISFQRIMNRFQLVFCCCLARCKVCWIKC